MERRKALNKLEELEEVSNRVNNMPDVIQFIDHDGTVWFERVFNGKSWDKVYPENSPLMKEGKSPDATI